MTRKQKQRIRNWIWRIAFMIIIVLVVANTGNQFSIMTNQEQIKTQNTDILDKLNLIDQSIESEQQDMSQVNSVALTEGEFDLICRIVMSESGDEGLQAQMAVAQTIYDRMNDWGDTLQKAVKTYSQHDNGDPTDSVRLAVANIFEGGMRVYEGGTYQFHDNTVDPYWTEGKVDRGSIGNLRFYGGYKE